MQKSGYKLLFALLILGLVISACGGSDTASNVPKIKTVAISDQIADSPEKRSAKSAKKRVQPPGEVL